MSGPIGAPLDGAFRTPTVGLLREELHRAGFTIVELQAGQGGVEIEQYDDPQIGILVSWTTHPDSFEPLDPRFVEVEVVMAQALCGVIRALGFKAEPFGTSFRVRVCDGDL